MEGTVYYGIPICAKKVVFVLDTSGSMRGEPIEAAKRALIDAVKKLPADVRFDIVMFDSKADAWKPELVLATTQAKQQAAEAVLARGLGRRTASHAALDATFTLDPEAIYFLSDGAPTDGNPPQIVEALSAKNRTRRVSIHTIGVGTDRAEAVALAQFMKSLAEANWGEYKAVDN